MPSVSFRRLVRADFPLLARWLSEPHVARWWDHDTSPAALEADFGACVDRTDPADVFIASAGGRPFGLLQRYLFGDNPGYQADLAPLVRAPDQGLSIDYLLGEPALLSRGYGSAMIASAVRGIWRDHPRAPSVIVPVCAANRASWRVLERCGFSRVAEGALQPDNPIDGWAHYVYRIARPARL